MCGAIRVRDEMLLAACKCSITEKSVKRQNARNKLLDTGIDPQVMRQKALIDCYCAQPKIGLHNPPNNPRPNQYWILDRIPVDLTQNVQQKHAGDTGALNTSYSFLPF